MGFWGVVFSFHNKIPFCDLNIDSSYTLALTSQKKKNYPEAIRLLGSLIFLEKRILNLIKLQNLC